MIVLKLIFSKKKKNMIEKINDRIADINKIVLLPSELNAKIPPNRQKNMASFPFIFKLDNFIWFIFIPYSILQKTLLPFPGVTQIIYISEQSTMTIRNNTN